MNNDHYVYLHKRKDNGIVFYIGHGRLNRAETQRKRSKNWGEVVKSAGGFDIEYLSKCLCKKAAIELENDFLRSPNPDWSLVNIAPARNTHELSKELIEEFLEYDEASPSALRWKKTFAANTRKNLIAGHLEVKGYWTVRLDGKSYQAHRLVWVLHNNSIDPNLVINHIDNNRSNNHISNLEPVTNANNSRKSLRNKNPLAAGINFSIVAGKYEYWIAYVYDLNSKRFSKSFNCKEYGYQKAKELAEQWRFDQLRILNSQGAEYNL